MEEFCIGVFANADRADRDSAVQPPDIALASRFYIAALFFDVLTQFHADGQLPPDLEQKRKYAKYRTIQIRNRQPLDTIPDLPEPSSQPSAEPPAFPVAPLVPSVLSPKKPLKQAEASSSGGFRYADDSGSPRSTTTQQPSSSPRGIDTVTAKKKLQQAISALDFGDYKTAASLSMEASLMLGSQ